MPKTRNDIIKPYYTFAELAKFLHITPNGARKLFYRLNVSIHMLGKKQVIYLTSLQTEVPDLFFSILEAHAANKYCQNSIEEPQRSQNASKIQFEK